MNETASDEVAALEFVRQVTLIRPAMKITPKLYAKIQAGMFGIQVPFSTVEL
jgi:hypothetical protein